MWKKFLALDILIVVAAVTLAAIWMFPVKDCGINEGFSTLDQVSDFLKDKPVDTLDDAFFRDENNWEELLYSVTDEGAWLHGDHKLQIYIIEPAEMYVQIGDTFEQAGWIKETIQGDSRPGEQILICGVGGVLARNEEAFFAGNRFKNIMKMGDQYLIFCEQTEYSRGGMAEYRLIYTMLNALNVSRDDAIFPAGYEPSNRWEQFQDRELLTYSNEEIEGFQRIKQKIFEEFKIDLEQYRGQ